MNIEWMCDLCGKYLHDISYHEDNNDACDYCGYVYDGYLQDVDVYVNVCAKCCDARKYGVKLKYFSAKEGKDVWK